MGCGKILSGKCARIKRLNNRIILNYLRVSVLHHSVALRLGSYMLLELEMCLVPPEGQGFESLSRQSRRDSSVRLERRILIAWVRFPSALRGL